MFRAGVERVSVKATISMAAVRSMFVLPDGSGHTCFVRVQSGIGNPPWDTYRYSTGYPVYCRYSQHSLRFGVFDYTGTAGYPVLYCTVLYSCTVLCTVPGTRYSLLPFKVADFSYYPVPEF